MQLEVILLTYLAQSKCLINVNSAIKKSIQLILCSPCFHLTVTCYMLPLPKQNKPGSPTVLMDIATVCVALMTMNVEWAQEHPWALLHLGESLSHQECIGLARLGYDSASHPSPSTENNKLLFPSHSTWALCPWGGWAPHSIPWVQDDGGSVTIELHRLRHMVFRVAVVGEENAKESVLGVQASGW